MGALPDLVCVDPSRVSEFWPHVKPLLQKAVERTDLSDFSDVERRILRGQDLLWVVWNGTEVEAAAATQLYHGACIIVACGGVRRERWIHFLDEIEQYARNEGCRKTRVYGRPGWKDVLDGYKAKYVILEKELP